MLELLSFHTVFLRSNALAKRPLYAMRAAISATSLYMGFNWFSESLTFIVQFMKFALSRHFSLWSWLVLLAVFRF